MSVVGRILDRLAEKRRISIPGVTGALRAELCAELVLKKKLPILIGRDQADAEALYRDLAFLLGTDDEEAADVGLLFLGADEKSPYEEYSPDARAVMERINTLYRLVKEPKSVRAIVLTPHALLRKHIPPSYFDRTGDYLVAEEEIDRERLLKRLVSSGYNSVNVVEDPGTFSVRGGIIDIYSPHRSKPFRLDLFGDMVDSIRLFDPTTQRTEHKIKDAVILPARELTFDAETIARATAAIKARAEEIIVPSRKVNAVVEDVENQIAFFGIESLLPLFHEGGLVSIDAYLPEGDRVVYLLDESSLETELDDLVRENQNGYEVALSQHQIALPPEHHVTDGAMVAEHLLDGALAIETPEIGLAGGATVPLKWEETEGIRAEILRQTRIADPDLMAPLVERLKRWRSDGVTTVIVASTRGQAERVKSMLDPRGVNVRLLSKPFALPQVLEEKTLRDRSVHAYLALGEISSGFVLPESNLAFVSEEEIFGQRMKTRRRRTPAAGQFVSDLKDLEPGDFVVHVDFGIGKYHGLTRLAVNGVESDYLFIEYKGNDKLYLPVHRLKLVQKYMSAGEGPTPHLDKLGATTWSTTKKKVKDTLLKMAAELLRLQAMRTAIEGFALPAPDERFRQFEAEFAFEPTPDQQKAVDDVTADLQRPNPMDRLICGDVGYGKTEVSMRAAMMAFESKKQVAVLVPTTVLAAQHFGVFSERFQNFGAAIRVISRFQSNEEIKKTLAGLKEGTVDIVIGTHRLLGKDVLFKDLGLLVIDEEHRFGVAHKERLKKYRAHVHVLSMSATPIPRTLHMGFLGVRDLSMIATPPSDRLAVKTEVHKFSEDVIRDALIKEIRRGGQAFVVHNRVASINAFARMLERLVPEARIVIGHGQMSEERLEKVMVDFMSREYNVLLSTTIIESGIDIPNANTIVVNRADRMGLAQLYQLRGRVGRSKVRGFAHFLIPAGNLSKLARKRINVLQRFTELGAGFKVASKDLEIRGAGNILGQQQSGQIAKVGFEMYQTLLGEAIDELKGSQRKSLREPELNLPVPALIPDAFIQAPGERLSFYQRFNAADTDEATYDLLQEITDLYGTPPAEVENLAQLMLLKQRLSRIGALGLDYGPQTKSSPPRIVIRLDQETLTVSADALVRFVQRQPRTRKLTPEGKLVLHLAAVEDAQEILHQAKEQLDDLVRLRHLAA
jgi:transcription-repair coupling factor (superfamily II helicase)